MLDGSEVNRMSDQGAHTRTAVANVRDQTASVAHRFPPYALLRFVTTVRGLFSNLRSRYSELEAGSALYPLLRPVRILVRVEQQCSTTHPRVSEDAATLRQALSEPRLEKMRGRWQPSTYSINGRRLDENDATHWESLYCDPAFKQDVYPKMVTYYP